MRLVPIAALALVALTASAQETPPFAFPYQICDCDPTQFVFRTVRTVQGYAAPDAAGPVIRTVATGRIVGGTEWDEIRTVVARSAVAVVQDTLSVDAWHLGRSLILDEENGVRTRLSLHPGNRVEFLGLDAGVVYLRLGREVYTSADLSLNDPRLPWDLPMPEHQVWFHLVPRPGQPAAWVWLGVMEEDADSNVVFECVSPTGRLADCQR